ncbi:cytochrome P450 [Panaeolus papilionaceus]|nr:cytochrome P450 [Panaeolus papilionaceus]
MIVRFRMQSWAVATCLFWAAVLSVTFPRLLSALGPTGAFGFYAGLNVVAFVMIFFLMPETKHRTLEELDYAFAVPTSKHASYQLKTFLPYWIRRYVLFQKVELAPLYNFSEVESETVFEKGATTYGCSLNDMTCCRISMDQPPESRSCSGSVSSRDALFRIAHSRVMYWPEWLPGDGFKRKIKVWRKKMLNLSLEPHKWVKQQMAGEVAIPSFTSQLLESEPEPGLSLDEQDELSAKFPTSDAREREGILFVNDTSPRSSKACASRDEPPAPFTVPHVNSKDDEYPGYFIPRNSTLVPNIWAMAHDPEFYPDPFRFNPERFLPQEGGKLERDPRTIVFGFGRRMC